MRIRRALCFLAALSVFCAAAAHGSAEAASVSFSPIGMTAYAHGCRAGQSGASPEELKEKIQKLFNKSNCMLNSEINGELRELYFADSEQGELWAEFLEYWDYVNTDMPEMTDVCSDGLPDDRSLCIVVLGYVLNPDGTVGRVLADRCEVALRCAEKYPNARLIVTGGCSGGSGYAEGPSMKAWLIKHGVEKDRILVDDRASATTYNAINSHSLIDDYAPEVKSLILVTSDYHIRSAAAVFAAEFILSESDIRIVENVASATEQGFKHDYGSQFIRASAVIERYI